MSTSSPIGARSLRHDERRQGDSDVLGRVLPEGEIERRRIAIHKDVDARGCLRGVGVPGLDSPDDRLKFVDVPVEHVSAAEVPDTGLQ